MGNLLATEDPNERMLEEVRAIYEAEGISEDDPRLVPVDVLPEEGFLRMLPFSDAIIGSRTYWGLASFGAFLSGRVMGSGASADVFEGDITVDWADGDSTRRENLMAAVKVFKFLNVFGSYEPNFWYFIPRELAAIRRLRHETIVTTYHIFLQMRTGVIYVFMEMADQNLEEYLRFQKRLLNEDEVKQLFRQMARALRYMHSIGYSHRDVKLDNFLTFSQPNGDVVVKLSDFGFSTKVWDQRLPGYVTLRLTEVYAPGYRAPEVIQRTRAEPYDAMPADVWALGVCLFIMLTQGKPFNADIERDDYYQIILRKQKLRDIAWKSRDLSRLSGQVQHLVVGMLEPNFEGNPMRLTMSQVEAHPWLRV